MHQQRTPATVGCPRGIYSKQQQLLLLLVLVRRRLLCGRLLLSFGCRTSRVCPLTTNQGPYCTTAATITTGDTSSTTSTGWPSHTNTVLTVAVKKPVLARW